MKKEKIFKILKALIKNIFVFIGGFIAGSIIVFIFAGKLLAPLAEKDIGLGVIAVAPIMILLYIIMFGTLGGVLAVIIYNIRRYRKRK
jgi:hypothetical protein